MIWQIREFVETDTGILLTGRNLRLLSDHIRVIANEITTLGHLLHVSDKTSLISLIALTVFLLQFCLLGETTDLVYEYQRNTGIFLRAVHVLIRETILFGLVVLHLHALQEEALITAICIGGMERNHAVITLSVFFERITQPAGELVHVSLEIAGRLQVNTVVTSSIATYRLSCGIVHSVCPHRLLLQTTALVPELKQVLRRLVAIDTRTERITVIRLIDAIGSIHAIDDILRILLTVGHTILSNPNLRVQVQAN